MIEDSIEDALIKAMKRGVDVRVITNLGEIRWCHYEYAYSDSFDRLKYEGVKVKPYVSPNNTMRYKFMVIDGRAVIVGSYGYFTPDEDPEDLLVIKDPRVVKRYFIKFREIWTKGYEG